jgi:hypothetical protein
MIVVLVLILLLIASIALYLVMLGRLSAIIAEKGYGSLILGGLLFLFWFGGEAIGFVFGCVAISSQVHGNLTDALLAVIFGLPAASLTGGTIGAVLVFVMAWILPSSESGSPVRRSRRGRSSTGPLYMMLGLLGGLLVFGCMGMGGVGAVLIWQRQQDPGPIAVNNPPPPQDPPPQPQWNPPPQPQNPPPQWNPPPQPNPNPPPQPNPPPPKQPDPPKMDVGEHGAAIESMKAGKFLRPAQAGALTTYLFVASSPGDYIGQGKSYTYPNAFMTLKPNFRGIAVNVGDWSMNFAAPGKFPLIPGEYRNARRFPFNDDAPGLDFSGMGRGSNMLSGEFMVWEFQQNGPVITRLAVDFVQRSEGKGPPLFGVLRYNSSLR